MERTQTKDYSYELVSDNGKFRAKVYLDPEGGSFLDSPRDRDNIGRFVFRETRDYKLPNELDFNWYDYNDDQIEQFKSIEERYYIFRVDMYDHSGVWFSMHGEGMQCRRDTSSGIGFIAVPKEYNGYDMKEIHETKYKEGDRHVAPEYGIDSNAYDSIKLSAEEAEEIARSELSTYNQWNCGEIYNWCVEKLDTWTNTSGDTREERERVDSCCGYYDIEQAKDEAESILNYNLNK